MRRLIIPLIIALLILSGCDKKEPNIVFTALIESIADRSILVTTSDDVGFDKANVGYDTSLEIGFNLLVGQTVKIEMLPEIRESYPVQITAVRIDLIPETAEYRRITSSEAEELMTDDAVILDVRTRAEYDEGHIKDAVLIPDTDIKDKAEEALPDKQAVILVYCRSGRRSEAASRTLIELGYTNVYDFGGIIDWTGEIIR